jgi:hypothetical protein
MINVRWIENHFKENGCGLIEILPRNLTGGIEESHEKPQSGEWVSRPILKGTYPRSSPGAISSNTEGDSLGKRRRYLRTKESKSIHRGWSRTITPAAYAGQFRGGGMGYTIMFILTTKTEGKRTTYCHVFSDYRRVLDWQLDLLDHNQLHISVTVYYTLQLTTTESSLFLWRPRLQLCNHRCNQLLWRPLPSLTNWSLDGTLYHTVLVTNCRLMSELYRPWTDHKENTS